MTTIADINVLLPILFGDHSLHSVAWNWWARQTDRSVGLCVLTKLGTLRMLTNAKVMGGHPVEPALALAAWDTLEADPRCLWIDPDSGLDAFFRQYVKQRKPSPNLWADAWLASLAVSRGLGLTSFDDDFHAFGIPAFEHLKP
ncbi:MAG: hypothetical protein O2960_14205 [Verrucomicrobia bacterium]|nr:hypothetical protein [Verrucomicrobiota bacterium]